MRKNYLAEIRDYFGVSTMEFMRFWHSLTKEEKDYYFHVNLATSRIYPQD